MRYTMVTRTNSYDFEKLGYLAPVILQVEKLKLKQLLSLLQMMGTILTPKWLPYSQSMFSKCDVILIDASTKNKVQ